ncbi:hypothetical protein [Nonomuraea sp. NPDC005501]
MPPRGGGLLGDVSGRPRAAAAGDDDGVVNIVVQTDEAKKIA